MEGILLEKSASDGSGQKEEDWFPESFKKASWCGTTGIDKETGRIGITFGHDGEEKTRVVLDRESAMHLVETLNDSYFNERGCLEEFSRVTGIAIKGAPEVHGAEGSDCPELPPWYLDAMWLSTFAINPKTGRFGLGFRIGGNPVYLAFQEESAIRMIETMFNYFCDAMGWNVHLDISRDNSKSLTLIPRMRDGDTCPP